MTSGTVLSKGLSRAVAAVLGAFALVVMFATPASAHYVYNEGLVYFNGDHCVASRSEASDGNAGQGYHKASTFSKRRFFYGGGYLECPNATSPFARPPGYIAVKFQTYRQNGSQWALCAASGWSYNTSTSDRKEIYAYNSGGAPCGAGDYQTLAHSYTYNGSWEGGGMWSGAHTMK